MGRTLPVECSTLTLEPQIVLQNFKKSWLTVHSIVQLKLLDFQNRKLKVEYCRLSQREGVINWIGFFLKINLIKYDPYVPSMPRTASIHVRIFDAQVNCTSLNLTSTRYTGTETYVLITTTNIDY